MYEIFLMFKNCLHFKHEIFVMFKNYLHFKHEIFVMFLMLKCLFSLKLLLNFESRDQNLKYFIEILFLITFIY